MVDSISIPNTAFVAGSDRGQDGLSDRNDPELNTPLTDGFSGKLGDLLHGEYRRLGVALSVKEFFAKFTKEEIKSDIKIKDNMSEGLGSLLMNTFIPYQKVGRKMTKMDREELAKVERLF